MKKSNIAILMALALGLPAMNALAQDGNPPQRPPGGPEGDGPRRPVPPLLAALDANGDGVIDADEIANAPAALRKLDKNGDGKLTLDELRPPRPGGPGGPGGEGVDQPRPGQRQPGDGGNPPSRPQRPRPQGE